MFFSHNKPAVQISRSRFNRVVLAALNTPVEALEHILKAKEENKLLMVILLWFLWRRRNTIHEEGKRRSADTLARSIRLYAAENSKTQGEEKLRVQRPMEHWSRPPVGMLKMNCDASFKAESNTGSWGSSYATMMVMWCSQAEGESGPV